MSKRFVVIAAKQRVCLALLKAPYDCFVIAVKVNAKSQRISVGPGSSRTVQKVRIHRRLNPS